MKSTGKLFLASVLLGALWLSAGCTPVPNCGVSEYTVTKTDDTMDGVCSEADCSLREAVQNANACSGHQTVHLPAGSYHLTRTGADEDAANSGDLDITDDLTILGEGAPSVHGDGDRSFQIFSPAVVEMELIMVVDGEAILGAGILNESELTLRDFTCNFNTASMPPGGMGDARGGCIFNGGTLVIENGHFLENAARLGGAIYTFDNTTLQITGGTMAGNQAEDHGGALWVSPGAEVEIKQGDLRMNSAGIKGGAVWNNGNLTVTDTVFTENEAMNSGGGLYTWQAGSSTLYRTWFDANVADEGGAVFNQNGMVHCYQCSVTDNVAAGSWGGGFFNNGASAGLRLSNTTVSQNISVSGGAGIYNTGNLLLEFSTVAHNSPEGIHIASGAERKIRSSILADNPGGNCGGPALDSLGYNIESGGGCGLAGLDDLPGTDPHLQPLAMNGGIGPSHLPGTGSPALDTGDPDRCIEYDQRDITRPQNLVCDRGAVEIESGLGSISGWVFLDSNRNFVRDPLDGSMTGAMIDLKEGSCPGNAVLETASSASGSGYYEFLNVPAGTYCVHRSMIQQTLFPDYHEITLADGDQITDVNFYYLLSPPGDFSIAGTVWHDLCAVPHGTYTTPPPGCIELPGGGLAADGVFDPAEPGISGVQVVLKGGECWMAVVGGTQTDADGNFEIPNLPAGDYCLSIDALQAPNDSILIPGEWTHPVRGVNPVELEITLDSSGNLTGQNFGWDYQFLPEPPPAPPPAPRGFFGMNGFCRKGPGSVYETVTAFEEGREVEIQGRSELHLPLWWLIRDLPLDLLCWVSDQVLETEVDPEQIPTVIAPPTPTPTVTPTPLTCTRDLPQKQCEAAGGTWVDSATAASYCKCP